MYRTDSSRLIEPLVQALQPTPKPTIYCRPRSNAANTLETSTRRSWPSVSEVKTAIKEMNSDKIPGADGIPAALYKALGTTAFKAFRDILVVIWKEECPPADFRDATRVTLYKNGAKSDCENNMGISSRSIAGHILARILLSRLITSVSENDLPEAQRGFRPGRSTIDVMFVVRQVKEKCIEQRMDLYLVFIDPTKAFDTVNREALWTTLAKLGCPCKFTALVRLFHHNITGQVPCNGDCTNSFNYSNGVKQGCETDLVLFNLFISQVLLRTAKDPDLGVYVRYCSEGSVFDLRRLSARTKTVEKLIIKALFADGCALMSHKEITSRLLSTALQRHQSSLDWPPALGKRRS